MYWKFDFDTGWLTGRSRDAEILIRFNFKWMCETYGQKLKYVGEDGKTVTQVVLPLPQVRKVLKYVVKECHDENVIRMLLDYLMPRCSKYADILMKCRKE